MHSLFKNKRQGIREAPQSTAHQQKNKNILMSLTKQEIDDPFMYKNQGRTENSAF